MVSGQNPPDKPPPDKIPLDKIPPTTKSSCEHTHFDHLLCSAKLHHFITMEYITSNKGGRKLSFENNIYIKQEVLGGFCPGGFCPGRFCPRTVF